MTGFVVDSSLASRSRLETPGAVWAYATGTLIRDRLLSILNRLGACVDVRILVRRAGLRAQPKEPR